MKLVCWRQEIKFYRIEFLKRDSSNFRIERTYEGKISKKVITVWHILRNGGMKKEKISEGISNTIPY